VKKYLTSALIFVAAASSCLEDNMELLISKEEIDAKIEEVAAQINQDYRGKDLTVVMVLKGALCVTADLIRKIDVPCKIECIRASSYGYRGMTGGKLTLTRLNPQEIEGRDILIVDDIFETGKTIQGIVEQIKEMKPNSVKTLLLLVKDIPRKIDNLPDYILFHIPHRFVIGYGLDYKEYYRGLPGIYAFIDDKPPF
jgi:hypoxanthine phosphoribosyltransferase